MNGGSMMQAKLFFMPTRIVHGLGSISAIAGQVRAAGGSKVFVCTDGGLTAAGVTARVTALLEEAELPFVVFDQVEEDPGVRTVSGGVEAFKAAGCDLVVALGGGSPMCAGKGIALVAANGGVLTDYEGFNKAASAPYPVIAVPTTAGSGTEVSKVTILTDEARGFKMSILDERTYPTVAILDGGLMESLPAWPALVAGMDALAHALDAVWSVGATDFSDGLAAASAATIFDQLPRAALTGDLSAKQRMLEASTIANMATGTALPGLAHVLSQPLGRLHLSHGLATGIMLPYALEFNLPVASAKIAPVARLLGEQGDDRELAEALLVRLVELMVSVGFPTTLDPAVVTDDEIPALVEQCTKVVNYRLNVRNASPADLERLYRQALGKE
jgi:alcohol dehydrogenase class IV